MNLVQVVVLACIQGLAELLPVSSSAHVILAEKAMGLDPTSPDMTLLLVTLHTGTMFAVIVYFRNSWRETYFATVSALRQNGLHIVLATTATGLVGLALLQGIKRAFVVDASSFEIELLFGNTKLIATSLALAGVLIIVSSRHASRASSALNPRKAFWIGAAQGLCLPFRGLSRSGTTISTALLLGVSRRRAEEFSFALAVVLTPPVIVKEGYRFYQANTGVIGQHGIVSILAPSLMGMVLSFLTGLGALRWLSRWLEHGRWHLFGIYCLFAALVVLLTT